jgi:hypothetical protein
VADLTRSTPLPPITRLDDRLQCRRCVRLRRLLRSQFANLLPRYNQAFVALRPVAEPLDLDKYYDIYDITELDLREAAMGCSEDEFDDPDSLKVLKTYVARYQTARKVLLCCLLALDANGEKADFGRWSSAVDEIRALLSLTLLAENRLRHVLDEEPVTPVAARLPLTPGRERWRAHVRRVNTLSTGIRGLQAKMHLLREESDKTLEASENAAELGPSLLVQYEAIGADLKLLLQDWEEGRTTLARSIDRNEKRRSTMSSASELFSPAVSLSGTSVDDSPAAALRALAGQNVGLGDELSASEAEEVFEAVAIPRRPRASLTREERIAKVHEERVRSESSREARQANTHMLRELESVIRLRPKGERRADG